MGMEANDNRQTPTLDALKARLHGLVENIGPGPDGRPSIQEICRTLERLRPGTIDQAHARHLARRAGLYLAAEPSPSLPDLSRLDYADA